MTRPVSAAHHNERRVVLLATGGTIAGASQARGADADAHYQAAQLAPADLVAAVPPLVEIPLEVHALAQVDSKDMSHAIWQRLAAAAALHLARPEVAGAVVTHGTDTLEETAWFLHRVLAPAKPLVLTAAMRPATSLQADGPQNLLDAVTLARHPGARGVVAVLQGRIHGPWQVRKAHSSRLDAFSSGEAGALGAVRHGQVLLHAPWPTGRALGLGALPADVADWPRVAVLASHAGVDEALARALVDAACAQRVRGIIIEGTGHGTVHAAWQPALEAARAAGVAVWRSSRCGDGGVAEPATVHEAPPTPGEPQPRPEREARETRWPAAGALSTARARVELMLRLATGADVARGVPDALFTLA